MASDLSKLIQDGLCSTINGLLSLDTTLIETTKAHPNDLDNLNLAKIESTYELKDIKTTWSYLLPAYTASFIFNKMIADESEPVYEIDDDISDAMGEVVSNICGSLVTSINGSEFDDLGNESKFSIGSNQIIQSKELSNIDNIYRFLIDIDGTKLTVFMEFDEQITPYIDIIAKSEQTHYEEPKAAVEETEELENSDTDNLVNEQEEQNNVNSSEPTIEVDDESTEIEEENPQNKKLKLIIIIVASLLLLTILTSAVLYFTGYFDEPEVITVEETNTTKIADKDEVDIIKYKTIKKTDFKESDIDEKRLNTQLAALTKYGILNEKELAVQKSQEEERILNLEKEQELLEFAAKNKEENIFTKKEELTKREIDVTTKFTHPTYKGDNEENNTISAKQQVTDQMKEDPLLLKFITVQSLKFKLYKQLIKETNDKNARISICKNNEGRTVIYIGPFTTTNSQKLMADLLTKNIKLSNDITNIPQEEFNTRCSF